MAVIESPKRRRVVNILIAVILLAGAVAGINSGLASCTTREHTEATRPLSEVELNRLASMRMNNYIDGRVGIRSTIGQNVKVNGWVDWQRSLVYVAITGSDNPALVQAVPGVVAIRPGPAMDMPPADPPADGWRVRPAQLTGKEKSPLDSLLSLLLLLAKSQPDRADLLSPLKNEWIRRDSTNGVAVDVLRGPAVIPQNAPPTAVPSPQPSVSTKPVDWKALDTYGGAVGYWLDGSGRLRRIETVLAAGMATSIDLVREDKAEIAAVDAFGGRPISPRAVTKAEAQLLSSMRRRNLAAKGGTVTITLPVLPGALRIAKGWLNWERQTAYLSVHDLDDVSFDVLMHANLRGVAIRKTGKAAPPQPPLPAPKGKWEQSQWNNLRTSSDLTDLDVLLAEALSMAARTTDNVTQLQLIARRLRVDVLNGVPMGVFELPKAQEQGMPPGTARTRYWVDNAGVLRRLEIRTATGGFAQFDVKLGGKIPSLPASVS